MKTDGIAAAFELIIEEIEAAASEIATQGSQAFHDKAYDTAQQLSEGGKSLQSFRAKVVELLEEWQSGIDVTTRQRFSTPRPKAVRKMKTHTKGRRTRLRVTFDGGPTIEEYYAADTFALALQRMGFDRVAGLGITERNMPLVGDIRSDQYGQRRVDGKWVCTHSSTPEKKETLERVAKKLGVGLRVEIV